MSFPQGRRKRDDRGVPVGYVAGRHATENAAGKHFEQSQIKKPPSPRPGTEAREAPWYHPDLAMNNVLLPTTLRSALLRGRDGIHYSGFTDSGSEASSATHRLGCTIHQLSQFLCELPTTPRRSLLELRSCHRLLCLARRPLPGHLGQKPDEPFCRTEQGIAGKNDK